jgi:hypothetical protein
MQQKNRRVLLILVMLLLAMPVALAAAANDSAASHTTRSFSQTAVHTLLTLFAEPDCPPAAESFRQGNFDMTQPVPDCWLLIGPREIQIE